MNTILRPYGESPNLDIVTWSGFHSTDLDRIVDQLWSIIFQHRQFDWHAPCVPIICRQIMEVSAALESIKTKGFPIYPCPEGLFGFIIGYNRIQVMGCGCVASGFYGKLWLSLINNSSFDIETKVKLRGLVESWLPEYHEASKCGSTRFNGNTECFNLSNSVLEQDCRSSIEWFFQAAHNGYIPAQYVLGLFYYHGIGSLGQERVKAVTWFTEAARQGHASAMDKLGTCYAFGHGVTQDYKKAVDWYTEAVVLGVADAQFRLGYCYYYGIGAVKDYDRAFRLFDEAARKGHVRAECMLALCHDFGNGVSKDPVKAYALYNQVARSDPALVMFYISDYYYGGCFGLKEDYGLAVKWHTKEALKGSAEAQFRLGYCYFYGCGVTKNQDIAVVWFQEAAKQNHAKSKCMLGIYYDVVGEHYNPNKAVNYYTESANHGFAVAQYKIGDCYYCGDGVHRDYEKALKYYTEAANQGFAVAQYKIGDCYYCGDGVPKDYEQSLRWKTASANQGSAVAQCIIGDHFYYDIGDSKMAMEWYEKAAYQGFSVAQRRLVECYDEGLGELAGKSDEDVEKAKDAYTYGCPDTFDAYYGWGNGLIKDYECAAVIWFAKT